MTGHVCMTHAVYIFFSGLGQAPTPQPPGKMCIKCVLHTFPCSDHAYRLHLEKLLCLELSRNPNGHLKHGRFKF